MSTDYQADELGNQPLCARAVSTTLRRYSACSSHLGFHSIQAVPSLAGPDDVPLVSPPYLQIVASQVGFDSSTANDKCLINLKILR